MKFPTLTMFALLALGAVTVSQDSAAAQDDVSLILSQVTAQHDSNDTLFQCDVILKNDTGSQLAVTTNFYSVFDGLEIVVTDAKGKVLKQQSYIHHQSPFTSDGREFPLLTGETKDRIVFPISEFGEIGQSLKIRLVGTLPGSSYSRILSTETLKVALSKRIKSTETTD